MNIEKRTITSTNIEVREAEEGGYVIEGIAAMVGKDNDMGWYIERIEPGAFDGRLNDDVRFLINHDPNLILARTKSGTGELFTDDNGNLCYRYTTPNRTYAKDLADAIRSGDIDQSSYAFTIDEQDWEERADGKEVRTIKKYARLYDVSPVTYPADPDTSVAKRSYEMTKQEEKPTEEKEVDNTDQKYRDRRLSLISNY
jgi:HK97 family phage prohead protease